MAITIVTGGSTGIGRQIALSLAAEGHSVVVNSIHDVAGGEETVRGIESVGGIATYFREDVSTLKGSRQLVSATQDRYGVPTVLVNNAGATRPCEFGSWSEEHWNDMLGTNLLSTAMMSQSFVMALPDEMSASIVNIASVRGLPHSPRIGIAAYCAAKAGVLNLTTALARALAPRITVNAISPGFVETSYMARVDDDLKTTWLADMPIERFVNPDEVARAVSFLIAEPAVTGANIVIDGAWTISAR